MSKDPRDLYIFEGLSQREVDYFLMMSETVEYRSGQSIITEGQASNKKAYFIQSGSVEVTRKGKPVAAIGPGELFGEIALITDEPRTATVKANGPVTVLAIRRDEFAMLATKNDLKLETMRRIRENLRADRQ